MGALLARLGITVVSGCGSPATRIAAEQALNAGGLVVSIIPPDKMPSPDRAFKSRPFVLCGLPVRRPPTGDLIFERRNGNFLLQITGRRSSARRSGRIAWCQFIWPPLAAQQKTQIVRFRRGSEMLETSGMQKGVNQRLVSAFETPR